MQGCDLPGQVHVQDSAIFAEVLLQLILREHIANIHVWPPRAHPIENWVQSVSCDKVNKLHHLHYVCQCRHTEGKVQQS